MSLWRDVAGRSNKQRCRPFTYSMCVLCFVGLFRVHQVSEAKTSENCTALFDRHCVFFV